MATPTQSQSRNRWKSVAIATVLGSAFLLFWRRRTRIPLYQQVESIDDDTHRKFPCRVEAELRSDFVAEFLSYARAANATLALAGKSPVQTFYFVRSPERLAFHGPGTAWFIGGSVGPKVMARTGGQAGGPELQTAVGRAFGLVAAECGSGGKGTS